MIRFMVLGAPRSGTAWAAEWLGALHDPLWDHYYENLPDEIDAGVCCTGLALFPRWVNKQDCPKIILHRSPSECEMSLHKAGLPSPPAVIYRNLDKIFGLHLPWTDLWEKPYDVWTELMTEPFDKARHEALKSRNIQSDWRQRMTNANPEAQAKMLKRGFASR